MHVRCTAFGQIVGENVLMVYGDACAMDKEKV